MYVKRREFASIQYDLVPLELTSFQKMFVQESHKSYDRNLTSDVQHNKNAHMQFADNAGPDQPAHKLRQIRGFHCPRTASMDSVVYVHEQKMCR